MSRHVLKSHPFLESLLNGAMLAHMHMPGQNGGRPFFVPGAFPTVPDQRLESFKQEPVAWEDPWNEEAYLTHEAEMDDLAP